MKNQILFLGDSHSIHCFANGTVDVFYLIDVTLNKIRQFESDLLVNYGGFFQLEHIHKYEISDDGVSIVNIINNSNYEYVCLSIGEIDVRFHNSKLIDDDIYSNTLEFFSNFLKKIEKKIILMSVTPPGFTSNDTENRDMETRIFLTKKINSSLKEMSTKNGFVYFDVYTDFVKNEILDSQKSDGGVHISKSFQSYILDKLKNYVL
jgi:hypothetical protein